MCTCVDMHVTTYRCYAGTALLDDASINYLVDRILKVIEPMLPVQPQHPPIPSYVFAEYGSETYENVVPERVEQTSPQPFPSNPSAGGQALKAVIWPTLTEACAVTEDDIVVINTAHHLWVPCPAEEANDLKPGAPRLLCPGPGQCSQ